MIGAISVGALVLAGCGSETGGGEDLGTVTLACTVQDDWCEAMTAAFTEATGIGADFIKINAGETLARLEASRGNPDVDVFFGSNVDSHIAAYQNGFIEEYTSPSAEEIPAEFKDPDGIWTAQFIGVLGFCSNAGVIERLGIEDLPRSWDALLDSKFENQISVAHPSTSGTAYTTLWTQVELTGGDEDAAFAWLKDFDKSILQYPKAGTAPSLMAGRGEVATGIVYAHDCQKLINEGFTELEISFAEEGTGYELGAVSLIKDGPNTDAGKAFIDWTLTPEAQGIAETTGSYQVPTHPDVAITENMIDLDSVTRVDYDAVKAADRRSDLTARFDNEIGVAADD